MKGFLRHKIIYTLARIILTPYLKLKFNYRFEKAPALKHSYIVLSNHNTDYDCLLVGLSFKRMMYYVASEHIFRWAFAGRLISYLVSPIPRVKATKEVQTVKEVIRRLKAGANVCIFAEGNRSYNGETGSISDSTGKLIKLCKVTLITYRLDGGYFSSPRWSKTLRRGAMTGKIVREYTPEMIESMTVDEINSAIHNDLYVNAYEEQKNQRIKYHGKKLSEELETALYICPQCDNIGALSSKDDKFTCTCGLDIRYSPYGYFETDDKKSPPFKTVLDWSKWQSARVIEKAKAYNELKPDKPIVSDNGQTLCRIDKASGCKIIGTGILELYHDRIVLACEDGKHHAFDFKSISDIAIHGQMVLIFSTVDKESYEIKSDYPRSALKYIELYNAFNNIQAKYNKHEE